MSINMLKEKANIFTGVTTRGRVENNEKGDCHIIQLRDFEYDMSDFAYEPFKVDSNTVPSSQLLKAGDVLLVSKGTKNKAFLYTGEFSKAVANSAFIVIRLNTSHIKPDFLNIYLNSDVADDYFSTVRSGTSTASLSIDDISTMKIPIPPMQQQDKLCQAVKSQEKYQALLYEIADEIETLKQAIIFNQLIQK